MNDTIFTCYSDVYFGSLSDGACLEIKENGSPKFLIELVKL